MAQPARQHRTSYADYLELERQTDLRHEYLDGEVWAMAGGTLRHSAIKTNLSGRVFQALDGGPCRSFDSDAKVLVESTDHATYPDLAVVCGPVQRAAEDRHALTNPTVLFEVLSSSTEAWDRGGKFISYQQLPSLRHYVLIGELAPQVEHYSRGEAGRWTYTRLGPGETLTLDLPEGLLRIDIDALYRNLPDEGPD